jgi:adenosine deaminase
MAGVTKSFIIGLPKAEMHLHLEGSLEPELKLELARKNKIDIGQTTIDEVRASYQFTDLTSFLSVYYPAMNVLQTEDDFSKLVQSYLLRAKENGVKYAELFFDPQAHTSRGVAFETVIKGYYDGIKTSAATGVDTSLIMCFLRDMSAESAMATYEAMLPYKDMIIGIGLDSDEKNNPPEKFTEVFGRAKADGLHITMHCDIDQVDSIEHIRTCLKKICVERLDHGTNIVEDPDLVDYAIENKIGFTCCPVSNSFVTADMKGKEIKHLLHKGALVTVNSDDPAYFQSYVADDMYTLADAFDLTKEDIVQLAKNSFEASWLSLEKKRAYIAQIDAYAAAN